MKQSTQLAARLAAIPTTHRLRLARRTLRELTEVAHYGHAEDAEIDVVTIAALDAYIADLSTKERAA